MSPSCYGSCKESSKSLVKSQEESDSKNIVFMGLQEAMNIVLKTGSTKVLLKDALRRPLLEVELGEIMAVIHRPSSTLLQVIEDTDNI